VRLWGRTRGARDFVSRSEVSVCPPETIRLGPNAGRTKKGQAVVRRTDGWMDHRVMWFVPSRFPRCDIYFPFFSPFAAHWGWLSHPSAMGS
jgi:hypothetical protein